jgi:hypothetical protein
LLSLLLQSSRLLILSSPVWHWVLGVSLFTEGFAGSRRAAIRVMVVAGILSVSFAMPSAAPADVRGFEGEAVGASADLQGGDGAVIQFREPTVTLPAEGGGPFTASSPAVTQPLLTTGLVEVSTQGQGLGTHAGTATSSAEVASINIGETPIAESMAAQCTANGDGASGTTTLVGATIPGIGALPTNPAPNTPITSIPDAEGITVVLNEQMITTTLGSEAKITVRAFHVLFDTPDIDGELIIGEVTCGVIGPDVLRPEMLGPTPTSAPAAAPVLSSPRFTG